MRKRYDIEVDCANCAAKMEDAARRVDGVNSVTFSFLGQKMMLDAPDERFDKVLKEVVKTCRRIEPDFQIAL